MRLGNYTNVSVQFSLSVVSDSLPPRELQHARPPCPSPTPGVHSDSRPLSQWCHPAISSSVVPFSPLPPIPPSIRVFSHKSTLPMRWPKYWSFSFSIIPSKEIPGLIFRIDWLDLLAVQGTLKSLLQHHSSKHQFFSTAFMTLNTWEKWRAIPWIMVPKRAQLSNWIICPKSLSHSLSLCTLKLLSSAT